MSDTKDRVGLIVYNGTGFLLEHCTGKSMTAPHTWDIPKGHIDEGENPRKAIEREVWEEAHIKLDGNELDEIGTYSYQDGEITLYYLEADLDVKKMICTSYFDFYGVKKPEVDKFEFCEDYQERLYKGLGKIVVPIMDRIKER